MAAVVEAAAARALGARSTDFHAGFFAGSASPAFGADEFASVGAPFLDAGLRRGLWSSNGGKGSITVRALSGGGQSHQLVRYTGPACALAHGLGG